MSPKNSMPSDASKHISSSRGEKVNTYSEDYPSVAKLRVEVTQIGPFGERPHVSLTEASSGPARCDRPGCNGSIKVENIIEMMVRGRQSDYKGVTICDGRERMGKQTDRNCAHKFSIKAHVDYLPDATALPIQPSPK